MTSFRSRFLTLLVVYLLVSGLALAQAARVAKRVDVGNATVTNGKTWTGPGTPLSERYGNLPLSFEKNAGQSTSDVKFLARGRGYTVQLKADKAVFVFSGSDSLDLSVKFVGASPQAAIGLHELPGKTHYYFGKDSRNWLINVPSFGVVKYQGIYPGIDLLYYGRDSGETDNFASVPGQPLEYDFVIAPGADLDRIRLQFDELSRRVGSEPLQIQPSGELVIVTGSGEVRFHKPAVYQPAAGEVAGESELLHGKGTPVEGRYLLEANNTVRFEVPRYDHSKFLVIDPVLSYATYTSVNNGAYAAAVGVDAAGNAYIAGVTDTGYQTGPTGHNVFVAKLNPQGDNWLYTTILAGSQSDAASGIAVDSAGDAYVAGSTVSADFPTTPGAFMTTCSSPCGTSFVAKLSPTGTVDYSTLLGTTWAYAIAIDAVGNAYITGATANDVPFVKTFESTPGGAYVQKLDPTGSTLIYSTYLGGYSAYGIAVDSAGSAYVVGSSGGAGFPLQNPLEYMPSGGFLTKLTPDGSGLVYSTYLGGSATTLCEDPPCGDFASGVAVDAAGSAYVTGLAASLDFPFTMNAYNVSALEAGTQCNTPQVFLLKVDPTGSALDYSTLIGCGGGTQVAIALDPTGSAWLTGWTSSSYFPVLNPVQSSLPQSLNNHPSTNAGTFVTKLDSSGRPAFSTYLGGAYASSLSAAIAADATGSAYIVGFTGNSSVLDFPLVNPAPGTATISASAFVAKVSPANGPVLSLSPRYTTCYEVPSWPTPLTQCSGTLVLRNVGSQPLNIEQISLSDNFTSSGNCGSSLAPGTACQLMVANKPGPSGSCTVTITSNAPGSPQPFQISPITSQTAVGDNLLISNYRLQFPTQFVATASVPQSFTLTNITSTPEVIGEISAVGDISQTNDCPTALSPGNSCTVTVISEPSGDPTYSGGGSVKVATDVSADTEVFVDGAQSANALVPSAPTVQFGPQYVGTTPLGRVVSLTNTSNQPLTASNFAVTGPFSQTNNCTAALASHASCRVAITFVPTGNEQAKGVLTVTHNGTGGSATVTLAGTGLISPDLSISPLSLSFPDVLAGATLPVTLTNASSATLTISEVNLTSGFTETDNCVGSLAAGASCTINVTFAPSSPGNVTGTLSIQHSGRGNPQVISLSGSCLPLFWVASSLSFDQQAVGTESPAQGVEIHSYGNSLNPPVTITGMAIAGDFVLVQNNCPTPIPSGFDCNVQVAFKPTAPGLRTGTLIINATDALSPHVVALSGGVTVTPGISLNRNSLNLGYPIVGTTGAPQTVSLTSTGDGPLTITSIAVTGQFSQTNNCPTSLPAGESCTISVTFAPTLPESYYGTLVIQDSAAGSPHSVALTGAGVDLEINTDVVEQEAAPGDAATFHGTIWGVPSWPVSITCSGTIPQGACTVSPASSTIGSNSQVWFTVSVTTTAAGSLSTRRAPRTSPPVGGPSRQLLPVGWFLVVWFIAAILFTRRPARFNAGVIIAFVVLLFFLSASCGGGGGGSSQQAAVNTGTPTGTYSFTITAKVTTGSSTLTHSCNIEVKVY